MALIESIESALAEARLVEAELAERVLALAASEDRAAELEAELTVARGRIAELEALLAEPPAPEPEPQPEPEPEPGFIRNGSFTEGLAYWEPGATISDGNETSAVVDHPVLGTAIEITSSGSGGGRFQVLEGLQPGVQGSFTFRSSHSSSTWRGANLAWYNAAGNKVQQDTIPADPSGAPVVRQFTAPAAFAVVRLWLWVTGAGTAAFTGVEMEVDSLPKPDPAPQPEPGNPGWEDFGFDNAADAAALEARADFIIKKDEFTTFSNNHKGAPARLLAQLSLGTNDAYARAKLVNFWDNTDPPSKAPEQFTMPGIAWAVCKYGHTYAPGELDNLKARAKGITGMLTHGTENQAIMKSVAAYLFGEYWSGESGWNGGTMTSEEFKAQALSQITSVARSHYDKGYEENLGTSYTPVHIYPYLALYECAQDPAVRAIARAALTFYVSNLAANHFYGLVIPPYARQGEWQSNTIDVVTMQKIYWLWWGDITSISNNYVWATDSTYASVAQWRPDPAIVSVARGELMLPYAITGSSTDFGFWGANSPGSVIRYAYRHRLFATGSGVFNYTLANYTGNSGARNTTYWAYNGGVAVLYKSTDQYNYVECSHPYWTSNDWQWRGIGSPCTQIVQHKAASISLFNIPTVDPLKDRGRSDFVSQRNIYEDSLIKEAQIRYPKTIDEKVESEGWVFLREGDVYIAVNPVAGYTIDTGLAGDGFNTIVSAGGTNVVIIDVATSDEYPTFLAFQNAIKANALNVDLAVPSATYQSLSGDVLNAIWSPPNYAATPKVLVQPSGAINGVPIARDADYDNATAVIKSPVVSLENRVLTVQSPRGDLVVDWTGETPVFGGSGSGND